MGDSKNTVTPALMGGARVASEAILYLLAFNFVL